MKGKSMGQKANRQADNKTLHIQARKSKNCEVIPNSGIGS